ncbi:epoxide hydrolase family protein [Sphingomonas sp.]|uniref:epoxide hydrolase family protein n=1 Tax=Sphingomonas sp. TaxID=28214 RepID=UPI003AFFE150
MHLEPFQVAIPDDAIDDLHRRIDATRWPDRLEDVAWEHGTELGYLRDLIGYWRNGFDWRRYEARINTHPQFIAHFDGLATHMIHARSPHAHATPLLLMHGWPGSIVEFLEVIPRLTEPERFGGSAKDACHVVCPSLPGYGFSQAPQHRGMGPKQVAERHLKLMRNIGYERFFAQGGDWGAIIARFLPELAGDRLLGLHLNLVTPDAPAGLDDAEALCTREERALLARQEAAKFDKLGYAHVQGTRPQTVGYGLSDSPVGLCAWITEKFHAWSDHNGDLRDAISWDDLLGNVSIYWFTNSIASSMRLYREAYDSFARGEFPRPGAVQPLGVAIYPAEMFRAPKAWIEHDHHLIHWFEADRGGHFAALEQPAIFAQDVLAFSAALHAGDRHNDA